MADTAEQLVFELPHRQALGLEDFLVSSSNAEAVALVDRWPAWPERAALISGPSGCGKSHLANVWRLRSDARLAKACDVTRARVPEFAAAPALVIEDVEHVAEQAALFHLLNLVREQRSALLMTAHAAPGDLGFELPDLASRLKAAPHAAILAPDDDLLRAVLVKLFFDRQLGVEPNLIDYVLMRMERSLAGARAVAAEIDRQSLVLQRRVTRSVAAIALQTLGFEAKAP